MKLRSMVWIALGIILIFSAAFWEVPKTKAKAGDGSCVTCHETQGENPVRDKGEWHIQHSDLPCETCHGGNPEVETEEEAHAGQVVNPLTTVDTCAMCHAGSETEYIATYQAMITPEAESTTAAPTEAAPSQATPTGAAPTCVTASQPTATATVAAPQVTATATPASVPAASGSTASGGGFSWAKALQFTRGPLFTATFWFCVLGLLLRLVQALRSGWKHQTAGDKQGRTLGILKSFATGLLVLPFIPTLAGAFRRKPVIYVAGGLFHLGLLAVILFSKTHMSAIKGQVGFGWPVLPAVMVDWLAAIGILAMLALLINRLVDPVLRLISGPAEWVNWLVVFLPMLTGFILAHKLALPYQVSFTIHMGLVDFLLVWIPLSRISHFVFYFISRAIHGVEFNARRVAAD